MKRKIRKKILVAIWVILFCLLGLIASIDNSIVTTIYVITLALLGNTIRKRYGLGVR